MATEHEIKLVATLDTSRIKDQVQQAPGGGQTGAGAVNTQANIAAAAQTAASVKIAQSAGQFTASIHAMQLKLTGLMTAFMSLQMNISAVNENIRSIYAHLKGFDAWSVSLSKSAKGLADESEKSTEILHNAAKRVVEGLDRVASSANNAANAQNKAERGGGGGALNTLGGKFGLQSLAGMTGRFIGWGSVFKAFTTASQALEQTDPEEKTFASAVFRKAPRAAMDALTLGITYYARQALDAKKAMDESAASLKEMQEFTKKLNEEIAQAKFDKYVRESKDAIKVLSGDGLGEFVDEHRQKLDALKDKYNQLNDQIARGEVGRNVDEIRKKMADLANEISAEQELYDLASKKMEEAAEAAKKLAEETENLNKAFNKQQQQYQDTLQKEQRAEQRREWKYSPVEQLIRERAGINAEFNKATEAIKAIDAEISRLKEFYEIQTTNEGRSNIIDKINELIGQRSRISGQKGQAQSDIDAINSIVKSFRDAAEALKKKAQDLVDSEEFKQWQAALKGKSKQELDQMKKDLEEERDARREEAIEAYTKGSEAKDKSGQDYWRKIGEEAEKAMKDAETRIKEIESATKDDIKLEDPTDQMTSMGKIGMYMSMNEATLQDPKLEKLNHISLTLVQIERNTSQGTVSRFL